MKIKDILGEDGITITAVSGGKAKLSNGQEVDAKTLAPDPNKPGQYTMPHMDPNAIKPGAVVSTDTTSTTSEDSAGTDPQLAQLQQLMSQAKEPWLKNFYAYRIEYLRNQKSLAGEPGAGMGSPVDSSGQLKSVETNPLKWIQQNPSIVKDMTSNALPPGMKQPGMLDKIKNAFGMEETHHDTVHSGNRDVGGDATDNFIDQVRDRDFERAQRPLGESEELTAMLRIAGLR